MCSLALMIDLINDLMLLHVCRSANVKEIQKKLIDGMYTVYGLTNKDNLSIRSLPDLIRK